MEKIVVATLKQNSLVGCDVKGQIHTLPQSAPRIDEWFVSAQWYNSLCMRNIKYCGSYDVAIVDESVFDVLVPRLAEQNATRETLHIRGIRAYSVECQLDGYNFSVVLRKDTKGTDRFYCEWSQCKSHNHYRCEHAQYVNRIVPMEAVVPRPDPNETYDDILTY